MRWLCGDRTFLLGERPLIMGILNVTPDSFSDGGQYAARDRAVAHGRQMLADGADIVDVGGESTRPGAAAVAADEELRRVIPVIEALAAEPNAVLSIDTQKAAVAREAVRAGARIVNDVSALTADAEMAAVARETTAGIVLMHMRGTPRTMQSDPRYADVVSEVAAHLKARVDALRVAGGIDAERLAVDPGIGFGKTAEHNCELLANLRTIGAIGRPVAVGLSRKSFLGKLTGRPVSERVAGSVAGAVFCALNGAHVFRVHDVKETRDAVAVALALRAAARKHGGAE
jgi:dihydropteroate synthase